MSLNTLCSVSLEVSLLGPGDRPRSHKQGFAALTGAAAPGQGNPALAFPGRETQLWSTTAHVSAA